MRTFSPFLIAAGGFAAAVMISAGAPLAQQHGYSAEQIAEGRKLYDANCGRCHNNDGAGVPGVELFTLIRRATTDDDIAKLVQTGIPGTSMPPHGFSTPQALAVVAFMRSMVGVTPASATAVSGAARTAGATSGDPVRGRAIFTGKGGCNGCHLAQRAGGTVGPDLSAAGAIRDFGFGPIPPDVLALERAIVDPDAEMPPDYRVFQVVLKTGMVIRGMLLNQDTFSVQMHDEAKNLRSFQKSELKDHGFLPSAMPSYQGRLTPQEVADVVSYLLTLKG
jgi:putative heme-binding domain-containing protein